jgi:hypothetical protein
LYISKNIERNIAHFKTLNYFWRCALRLTDHYLFI